MKPFAYILGALSGLMVLVGVGTVFAVRSPEMRETVIQKTVETITETKSDAQTSLVHQVLGFGKPRTYLLLLLNNTEIRPAGGFIGSYAVVRMENGMPELLKVEGTEILDRSVPQDRFEAPPLAMQRFINVTKWQFRDSNWSPDFLFSTHKALELYKIEEGVARDSIDGVIAIDPTVVSSVLKITGPITVNGITFTSENFTRELEYEVEYGYEERGLAVKDRKQMLKDVVKVMVKKMATDAFVHWHELTKLLPDMLDQKHIVLYSANESEQVMIESRNWAGRMLSDADDAILWVDANLGAMKTDAVMGRALTYEITPVEDTYHGTVTMRLTHTGVLDKFTSRYRDYARLFVPLGAKYVRSVGVEAVVPGSKMIDQGEESGRQWFGGYVLVEPKTFKDVSITFELPPSVVAAIKNGSYNLKIQKQIGTLEPQLTLNLDFGKTVVGARPGEGLDKRGDSKYEINTTLLTDKAFQVQLAH